MQRTRVKRNLVPTIESFEPRIVLSRPSIVQVAVNPVVSVKDFGAVGDGITDDAPAIQRALDAGGTILVPAGDYRLGSTLAIKSDNTTLVGEGSASMLRLMDNIKKTVIMLPVDYVSLGGLEPSLVVNNVKISNLTISGNHNGLAEPGQSDYFGIMVLQANNVVISNVDLHDFPSDGISVSNGSQPVRNITIENSRIKSRRNGIHIGFVDGAIIRNNYIVDTPDQSWGPAAANAIDVEVEGYDLFGPEPHTSFVKNLLIENNLMVRQNTATAGAGVALQPAYGYIDGVTVRGNTISGHQVAFMTTGDLNIYDRPAGVMNVLVENNEFTTQPGFAVSGYPMVIQGLYNGVIQNNVMNDGGGGGFSYQGMAILQSKNLQILNNKFFLNPGTHTIFNLYWGGDSITITGNVYQTDNPVYKTDGSVTNLVVENNVNVLGSAWDETAPTLSFNLANGSTLSTATTIQVTPSEVGKVYFLVDGKPVSVDNTSPYSFSFDPKLYSVGQHTVTAVMVDSSANLSGEYSMVVNVKRGKIKGKNRH